MNNIYFSTEVMGLIILFILLFANIGKQRDKNRKYSLFMKMLIVNIVVVAADAITWLDLNWGKVPVLFFSLITLTYILPILIQAIFAQYLFEHINQRVKISNTPFKVLLYYSLVTGAVTFILCLTGHMFEIKDGMFYSGSLEWLYYVFNVICIGFLYTIIFMHCNKLGAQGLIVALLFCGTPFVSMVISLVNLEVNIVVPFMSIDMLVIYVMFHIEHESKLFYQSNIDELTGLYNRRTYEDDMMNYPNVPPEADFVYASIDINGLKQVNDNLGHEAGDELIRGAAYCLKRTFGNYGKVYRTGGDEFVAIFFADETHFDSLIEDVQAVTNEWHGSLVDSLSLSFGCATKREFPTESKDEMARVADKRMYDMKEQHYSETGVDRRGQYEAHKVLCSLYTKILRINLTKDNFSVVNMDIEEQTQEKGYSERISEWLEGFGKSGCVHEDNLEEYLSKTNIDYMRDFFKGKKASLTVFYRRKYDDGFKPVMMEIIPTKEYSDEDQSLFLYVKNIDI